MSYRAPLGQTPAVPTSQSDCRPGTMFVPGHTAAEATCVACPSEAPRAPAPPGYTYVPTGGPCGSVRLTRDPSYRAPVLTPVTSQPAIYQPSMNDYVRRWGPFMAVGAGLGAIVGAVGAAQSSQGRALVAGGLTGAGIMGLGAWFMSGMSIRG